MRTLILASALAAAGCATTSNAAELADTSWMVVEINGHPAKGSMKFGSGTFDANFGCNRIAGNYRINGNRLHAGPTNSTQMYCDSVGDTPAVSPMTLEGMALDVFGAAPRLDWRSRSKLLLSSAGGTIELVRN